MSDLVKVIDPDTGEVIQEWVNNQEEWCWGAKVGLSNELCGGCPYCLEMQSRHSGYKVEYEEHEETESCWCNPQIKQPCPECERDVDPDCWKCAGEGLVDPYDEDEPKIIIHNP